MTNIDPQIYQAIVIAHALELWHKHRMRVNSAYTPSAMMRKAREITGAQFKPRDYLAAAQALRQAADARKVELIRAGADA